MRSAASQGLFLIGKPTSKKSQGRLRRVSKRSTKNEETAKIREACLKRSGGCCECGCGLHFVESMFFEGAEMDHFAGRTVPQTIENCWMLTHTCHRHRTLKFISTETWNAKFAAHAAKHGYPAIAHVMHEPVRRAGP